MRTFILAAFAITTFLTAMTLEGMTPMPWFVGEVYIVPGALDHMARWLLIPTLILTLGDVVGYG